MRDTLAMSKVAREVEKVWRVSVRERRIVINSSGRAYSQEGGGAWSHPVTDRSEHC
jgi:hypothetical protein